MGAESSKSGESKVRHIRGLCAASASRRTIYKWQKRRLPVQFCSVVRHEERADAWSAYVDGTRWTQTEDFVRWPCDPPLSDLGLDGAQRIGRKLRACAEECGSPLHVVVCSPYFRCVQTAAEICREFGPDVRMLVDHSLGEVYGPSVMGDIEPAGAARPIDQAIAYCNSRGVACETRTIGEWPTWPEDLKGARIRFASRFLVYLHRSSVAQRNFAIVTHADCVGAALRMMPSYTGHVVERVEYGGHFIAKRRRRSPKRSRSAAPAPRCSPSMGNEDDRGRPVSPTHAASVIVAGSNEQEEPPGGYPSLWLSSPCNSAEAHNAWAGGDSDGGEAAAPQAAEGWQVQTESVKIQRAGSGARAFSRTVQNLVHSRLRQKRVSELLGGLSEKPLGDNPDAFLRNFASSSFGSMAELGQQPIFERRLSLSTFLFGASDVGNENDITSPGEGGSYPWGSTEEAPSLAREASRRSSRSVSSHGGSEHGEATSPSRRWQRSPPSSSCGSVLRQSRGFHCMELVLEDGMREMRGAPASRSAGNLPAKRTSWIPGGGTVGKGQALLRQLGRSAAALPRKRSFGLGMPTPPVVEERAASQPGGVDAAEAAQSVTAVPAADSAVAAAEAASPPDAEKRRPNAMPLGGLEGSALMRRRASQGLVVGIPSQSLTCISI